MSRHDQARADRDFERRLDAIQCDDEQLAKYALRFAQTEHFASFGDWLANAVSADMEKEERDARQAA